MANFTPIFPVDVVVFFIALVNATALWNGESVMVIDKREIRFV